MRQPLLFCVAFKLHVAWCSSYGLLDWTSSLSAVGRLCGGLVGDPPALGELPESPVLWHPLARGKGSERKGREGQGFGLRVRVVGVVTVAAWLGW